MRRLAPLVLLGFAWVVRSVSAESASALTCSALEDEQDPALVEMKYDIGSGEETILVHVQQDVTTFYKDREPPAHTPAVPLFNGLAAKFINMSDKNLQIFWEPHEGGTPSPMWLAPAFSTGGTASFPGHRFFYALQGDQKKTPVHRFVVGSYPHSVQAYDPFEVENDPEATERNLARLSPEQREKYDVLKRTVLFNEKYLEATGRSYLTNYQRPRPSHYTWRADYFGQEHWVTTKETHFVKHPPKEEMGKITARGRKRAIPDDQPRLLSEYRTTGEPLMNMTMKVISCAPRAFEISNFLSETEVQHILELATGIELSLSGVGQPEDYDDEKDNEDKHRTRTSYNSWVARERSPIVDAIYRRAADLLRIDEALLRQRGDGEYPDMTTSRSIAESLQLVHYDVSQEYTAHHDFGYNKPENKLQPERFATLLLYLNEGMEGGETAFPRWVNAETFHDLKATPQVGKAVLFYSMLPDGNMDDLSQHAALPVTKGEKWLMNLWVWDPVYKKDTDEEDEG